MPRRNLIRTNQFPYHVYARSNNKDFFYLPTDRVWKIYSSLLEEAEKLFEIEILTTVLMNNHFHLVLKTPQSNLDSVMHLIMKKFADKVNREARRINHVFGGPYKWTLIQDEPYLYNILRYVCQNPMRASMVNDFSDYPYLIAPKSLGSLSQSDWRSWLLSSPKSELLTGIRNSLKRRVFKLSKSRTSGRKIVIDLPHSRW